MWWPRTGENGVRRTQRRWRHGVGPRWAVADLEVGGPDDAQSYVLIDDGGTGMVFFDDGSAPVTCGSAPVADTR